jgi:hypothetical protein
MTVASPPSAIARRPRLLPVLRADAIEKHGHTSSGETSSTPTILMVPPPTHELRLGQKETYVAGTQLSLCAKEQLS